VEPARDTRGAQFHGAVAGEMPRYESGVAAQLAAPKRFASSHNGGWVLLTMIEAGAIVLASIASGILYHELFLGVPGPLRAFVAVGILAGAIYFGAMRLLEADRRLRLPNGWEALRDLTAVWIGIALLLTFVAFALKAGGLLSRGAMLTFFAIGEMALLGIRANAPVILALSRPAKLITEDVLVVGARGGTGINRLAAELQDAGFPHPKLATINAKGPDWDASLAQFRESFFSLARSSGPGDVCVAAEGFSLSQIGDIVRTLQMLPRAVRVVPEPSVEHMLHLPIRNVGGLYAVEYQKAPLNHAETVLKRFMDIALVVPAILLLLPVCLVVAIAIKLGSRGPVFFRQRRLGFRGEQFSILKLRTMTTLDDGDVVHQAQPNDARVTGIGRWLRKWSLDELPQLLNVLSGEMSLVGPRPHAVAHDQLYARVIENYEVRQHVKPGLTGWAQVNGYRGETRSSEAMRARIEHDIWYATNASLWLDIKILFLTVLVVLRRDNAY